MSLDGRGARIGEAGEAGAPPRQVATATGLPWSRLAGAWQALGPVLCLHPDRHWPRLAPSPGAPWPLHLELMGLPCATQARLEIELDSEGPGEWISFLEPSGRPGLVLGLLPDSDLLAWDRLVTILEPTAAEADSLRFRCERWRTRDPGAWCGRCSRLSESVAAGTGSRQIGLVRASVSAHGLRSAQRMARRFGARLADCAAEAAAANG